MAEGWLERIPFRAASEMIAASSEIPRFQDRARYNLSFQVEVILHRIWELRIIGN